MIEAYINKLIVAVTELNPSRIIKAFEHNGTLSQLTIISYIIKKKTYLFTSVDISREFT